MEFNGRDVLSIIKDKVDAETMAEMKEMVSFLSHELKRPLASAVLSLHTLKDGYLGELSTVQKESMEAVAGDLDRMSDVIKTLLDEPRRSRGDGN